jgi:hypothetical protein
MALRFWNTWMGSKPMLFLWTNFSEICLENHNHLTT